MVAWPWKLLVDAEATRRLRRQQQAEEEREASEQRAASERRARLTSVLGVAGFIVSVIGVPILWVQNVMLGQQLDLQKEAIEVSGPILTGTVLVVDDIPSLRLFSPGTDGIERTFRSGQTAEGDVWVRVEVTNSGRSVGTIASASVQHGETWLSARTLMCGVSDDVQGRQLVECELPVKVEPGGVTVFTYDLPGAPCSDDLTAPEEITASFNTTHGDVVVLPTKVLGRIAEACPRIGGE